MKTIWVHVYAYTVGFQQHPGAGRGDHKKLTMEQCAKTADDAVSAYVDHIYKECEKCSEP